MKRNPVGIILFCFAILTGALLPIPLRAAQLQRISDAVHSVVAHLKPTGRLNNSQHLRFAVSLPLRNQQALSDFLSQLQDPASPNFRKFLTPKQFTERFGPTEKDYEAVAAFAKANGLTVTGIHPNRLILDLDGTVPDIERSLHVTMRTYRHPRESRDFYAPDAEPTLDLAVPVMQISGLDDFARPHPNVHIHPAAAAPRAVPDAGSGPYSGYMGNDFRTAYVPGTLLTGSGQTVGLLEFDGYSAADITYYENLAGLPNVTLTNVLLDGFSGTPSGTTGQFEVSLDIEMALSMAPGVSNIIVYEAGPGGNWDDILNNMATDDLAQQMSCSWGVANFADQTSNAIFQQMAAQGQTFFTASGDSDAYTSLISFPSDNPYITVVGGTELTTAAAGGPYSSETVWNSGGGVGSSGGISTQFLIPSWQKGISMASNMGSTTFRNIPDVALAAENIYVRAEGVDQEGDGTSFAAPLWAGFMALVNQQALVNSAATVGFLNPTLYAIGSGTAAATDFHDITSGNNTNSASPNQFYAVPGYDLCSGWGTPNGTALINAITGPSDPFQLSWTPFAAVGIVGGPFNPASATYILVDSGTAPLTWTASASQSWLTLSATTGTLAASVSASVLASLNANAALLAGGTYSAIITYTDLATGFSRNRTVSLSVSSSPPAITSLPPVFTRLASFTGQSGTTLGTNPEAALIHASDGNFYGTTYSGGSGNWGTIFKTSGTGTLTTVYSFDYYYGGAYPVAPLLQVTDGNFYGTNSYAGSDSGVAFKMTPAGAINVLYNFSYNPSPYFFDPNGLTLGPDGNLYGTTRQGGVHTAPYTNDGAIFKMSLSGSTTLLHVFTGGTDGMIPCGSLTLGPDGTYYGTASQGGSLDDGTVYKITSGGVLTPLLSFQNTNGAAPLGGLLLARDGNFYGTTSAGGGSGDGTIFKMTPSGTLTKLCSFTGTNGAVPGSAPYGNLIQGNLDGNFYGTTEAGGAANAGTIFEVTPSGALTTLYSFTGLADGSNPYAGLVQGTDGNFYGTANDGGPNGDGTVFKITPTYLAGAVGSPFTFQITATNSPISFNALGLPAGLIVNTVTGFISGTPTVAGTSTVTLQATNGYGTTSAPLTIIIPGAPVMTSATAATVAIGQPFFYQVTATNSPTTFGAANLPAGFAINPSTGLIGGTATTAAITNIQISIANTSGTGTGTLALTVLPSSPPTIENLLTICSFTGTGGNCPGSFPEGVFYSATDGSLYGVTAAGGVTNNGTFFKITSGGSMSSLYSFDGTNGGDPNGVLVQASDGNFYGTTINDTVYGCGTIFRMTPSGSQTTISYFSPSGYRPEDGLSLGNDGYLYGAVRYGGNGTGALFKITPAGSLTWLHDFSVLSSGPLTRNADGAYPFVSPVQAGDGFFYGVTMGGGTNAYGTVYRLNSSGSFTTICSIAPSIAAQPSSRLTQASDGNFYGTSIQGGGGLIGSIFQVTSSGSMSVFYSFGNTNGDPPYFGDLTQGNDGLLYGISGYGGTSGNLGQLFSINLSGSYAVLLSFTGTAIPYLGEDPTGQLTLGADGNFYGVTTEGGLYNYGTVFKYIPQYFRAVAGSPFTFQIYASNNPTSYGATNLPSGLTLNASTGLISGTPTTVGTNAVILSASNANGTGTDSLTIGVLPPAPAIISPSIVTGTAGVAFSYQITATNNPTTYSATGLPPGLTLNTASGLISGITTTTGTTIASISAANTSGITSATLTLNIIPYYTAWQDLWFTAAQLADPATSGATASAASDGIPNLLKYALGLDPMVNGFSHLPGGSVITIGGSNYVTLTYTQVIAATDITYVPEVSGDLQTWYSGPTSVGPVSSTLNPNGLTETVTVRDLTPMSSSVPRFIRLEITMP